MKLKKSAKIEISKTMLGVLVTGVLGLLCVCIPLVYTVSEEIETKLLDKLASLDKESNRCQRIGTNLENTSDILTQSSQRVQIFLDSSDIFKSQVFDDDEIRKYLLLSSKKRLQVKENINLVDSQIGDSGTYVNTHQTNEALKVLLNKEYDIWFSFERFLLKNDSTDWKESELHFKSFDDNLLKWYELGNNYNSLHIKAMAMYDDITSEQFYSDKKFDSNMNNLYFMRRCGIIGIIITSLILTYLVGLAIKTWIKM